MVVDMVTGYRASPPRMTPASVARRANSVYSGEDSGSGTPSHSWSRSCSPKVAMHFHRDVLATADTFSRYMIKPRPDDVFTGTPPLGFTYGLGGLLLFPLRAGASTLLIERATPALPAN